MNSHGAQLSELAMMKAPAAPGSPDPEYTIVQTEVDRDFDCGRYLLARDNVLVAQGSGREIVFALINKGQNVPGTLVGFMLNNGKRFIFKVRAPEERAAGTSAVVWRSEGTSH